MSNDKRTRWLLFAGMCAGITAAAVSLLAGPTAASLPDDAVAQVGERVITMDAWQRAVAAVASDRRTELSAQDRRTILDRLVDEELLVQHGLSLGLIEQDRRLRGQLTSDVIAAATAGVAEPDEAALRKFYDDNRDYFSTPGRVRVLAQRADGAPFSPPVPDTLLPPAKLREYLGPRLVEAALKLEPGQSGGHDDVTVRVLEREAMHTPPFEEIRDAVRDAALRRAQEEALRELLAQLRADAKPLVRENLE